jgi:serine/threonine protein phosphatase PrpC
LIESLSGDNIDTEPKHDAIMEAIKRAFMQMDEDILRCRFDYYAETKEDVLTEDNYFKFVLPGWSGSCAVMTVIIGRDVYVANAGDTRAIIIRETDAKYNVEQLTIDQNSSEETEVARIKAEHPDEPYVISGGRVLGYIEPTRALGDGLYKWPLEFQTEVLPVANEICLKPPYVIAEPQIKHIIIDDTDDKIVLMTDGIYKFESNQGSMNILKGTTECLFNSDDNMATHLVRNCLSGYCRRPDEVVLMITRHQPRYYRDDMTALVISLNDSNGHCKKIDDSDVSTIPLDMPARKDRYDSILDFCKTLPKKEKGW